MSREDAEFALDAFSKKVGIADLHFDQSGTALLAFGENQELIFYYAEETERLQIWSPLNSLILSGKADSDCVLMRYLLEKNFPSVALNGAYFAVDGEMGVVLLGTGISLDPLNIDVFTDKITTFAQQVLTITATIANDVSDAFAKYPTPDVAESGIPILKA